MRGQDATKNNRRRFQKLNKHSVTVEHGYRIQNERIVIDKLKKVKALRLFLVWGIYSKCLFTKHRKIDLKEGEF